MSIRFSSWLLKYGSKLFPLLLAVMGLLLVVRWVRSGPAMTIIRRMPGLDGAPVETAGPAAVRPVPGEPIPGPGQPSTITAAWPWFRGPDRDAISKEPFAWHGVGPPPGPSAFRPCRWATATRPQPFATGGSSCSTTTPTVRPTRSAVSR